MTVPYFSATTKIRLFDAKTNALALEIDVSKFVPTISAAKANSTAKTTVASAPGLQTYKLGGVSSGVWGTTLILLVLGGAGFFIYRRRKNKRLVISNS